MNSLRALAYKITSELHPIVVQNVLLILIVQLTKHAYQKNVEIHVQDLVALMQNVEFKTIFRHASVHQAILAIRLYNALLFRK